jgi:dolichyl-phosphate beta-glucosyltransferase
VTAAGEGAAPQLSPPHLSLVVPAYNEERRIAASMQRIGEFLALQTFRSEVVAVDDGSDEAGLLALAAAVKALPSGVEGRIVRHEANRGKGAAVRTGALAAQGDYVAFIDADLATPPEDLSALLAALDSGTDVAVGVRNQPGGSDMRNRRGLARRLAGKGYAWFMQRLLMPDISDSQCPLKAFRRDSGRRLFGLQRIDTWAFDAELLFLARQMKLRVQQVPVSWHAVEGSRLRLNARTAMELLNLVRIRWWHRGVGPAEASRKHQWHYESRVVILRVSRRLCLVPRRIRRQDER